MESCLVCLTKVYMTDVSVLRDVYTHNRGCTLIGEIRFLVFKHTPWSPSQGVLKPPWALLYENNFCWFWYLHLKTYIQYALYNIHMYNLYDPKGCTLYTVSLGWLTVYNNYYAVFPVRSVSPNYFRISSSSLWISEGHVHPLWWWTGGHGGPFPFLIKI